MHVGHIRSTVLGDVLARVARYLGHHVITDNHLGDWGTQFGMLAAYMVWRDYEPSASGDSLPISDMEEFYREAKRLYDEFPNAWLDSTIVSNRVHGAEYEKWIKTISK